TAEGDSESGGWSDGASYGRGATQGDSRTDETVSYTFSSGDSYGGSRGSSGSQSSSRSTAQGYSRSTGFVTEHEEFREETGRQFCSLEEELERLIARIMRLDQREALIKVLNRPVLDIETPEIRHLPLRRRRKFGRRPDSPKGNQG